LISISENMLLRYLTATNISSARYYTNNCYIVNTNLVKYSILLLKYNSVSFEGSYALSCANGIGLGSVISLKAYPPISNVFYQAHINPSKTILEGSVLYPSTLL
jgi:hypothetical protein